MKAKWSKIEVNETEYASHDKLYGLGGVISN